MDFEMRFPKRGGGDGAPRPEGGPRRLLVLADLGGRESRGLVEAGAALAARPLVRVRQEDLDAAVTAVAPRLALEDGRVLEIRGLDDLHPDALYRRLGDLFASAAAAPPPAPATRPATAPAEEDAATVARLLGGPGSAARKPMEVSAVEALAGRAVAAHGGPAPAPAPGVDAEAAGRALRAILHQPAFQALEATWRALALLAARLEEDVELWLLDVSKAELAASGDGLADRVLSPPGGRAWSALIGAFSFGSGADDVDLLGRLAVLASRAAAPFVGGAAPELLGCRSLAGESDPARWPGLDTDAAGRWQSLRQSPDAVWVGLALPRFLARAPYGAKSGAGAIDAFRFEESTGAPQHDALCWASSAFLCALVLAAGEDAEPSGEIDDLPFVSFRAAGETEMYPAAEVFWSERAATAVLLRGLMPVLCQRDRNSVRIVRLQSIADPPAPLGG